jgi:putative DNA primase/helicase
VPFAVRIPDAQQDKQLRARLLAEAPGILHWMVDGCLDWQEHGLGVPNEVREATEGYRTEMDVLGAFVADCCVEHVGASVTAKALYTSYAKWCEETGEKPMTQTMLGKRLTERGLEQTRTALVMKGLTYSSSIGGRLPGCS